MGSCFKATCACKSYTSVQCCGSLGSCLLPDMTACPAWCAPTRALKPAEESSCFHTDGALFFPATSPAMQLRPKQILSEGKKFCTIQAKEINQSYVKRAELQVFVLTSTQSFMQDTKIMQKESLFQTLGPMASFLLCLKPCTACEQAAAFILTCDTHLHTGKLWHT